MGRRVGDAAPQTDHARGQEELKAAPSSHIDTQRHWGERRGGVSSRRPRFRCPLFTPAWASRCTHPPLPSRPGWAPPRPHPAAGGREKPTWVVGLASSRTGPPPLHPKLTHFISRSVKMRLSRHNRRGTVRMRMKGKASEATVDMTAQSTARQASCRSVNTCIRTVRTCGGGKGGRVGRAGGLVPPLRQGSARLHPSPPTPDVILGKQRGWVGGRR